MNFVKNNLFPIIIGLILLTLIACSKKEENELPTVRFLQPTSNLVIANDTVLTFIAEPQDTDGTIDRVEFSRNGTLIESVVSEPYTFDWSISSVANSGIYKIKATAYDNQGATGESEIEIEVKSYLSKWVGVFEGTSHHWSNYPVMVDGEFQLVTNNTYKTVLVNVNQSTQDSCLDFTITYNDTIVETKNDLKFSDSGIHHSQWGAGSGYGSLDINFESDSLYYDYFQQCGIPCQSGIDFVLGEQ